MTERTQPKKKQPKPLAEANRGASEQAAVNRARAFDLRTQRKTYREIATILGVCPKTAHQYVEQTWQDLHATTLDKAEMLRAMELETLDNMEARWYPLAVHPSLDVSTIKGEAHIEMPDYDAGLKAVDRVLKIQERRAKLLGLDQPDKLEHSGEMSHRHMTLEEWKQRYADGRA